MLLTNLFVSVEAPFVRFSVRHGYALQQIRETIGRAGVRTKVILSASMTGFRDAFTGLRFDGLARKGGWDSEYA